MTILETIGNTPLVEIKKLNPNPKTKIYAKLEGFNPTGSVKDRIAMAMVTAAEKKGVLKKGKTIIEATSGNTGIGVAMVAAMKGYKTIIVMPESMSEERRKMIKAFGAQLILVKPEMWRQGAMDLVKKMMARDKKMVTLDQFANQENCRAHYRTTGKEILNQVKCRIDYLICGLGTGGTITGVAKRLKEKNPKTVVVGLQPKVGEKIEGLMSTKAGCVTPILAPSLPCGRHSDALIDTIIEVSQEDAFAAARELVLKEGIFAGASSGAAMSVSLRYAKKIPSGTIVTLFPDRGEKYLSTPVFNY
jgi:cysteine synthase B